VDLCGKALVVGGPAGVASVRSCEKLPLCPTEPMPASSKTDLLLAKAKPICDSGSASEITYLRREYPPVEQHLQSRERRKNM